MTTDLGIHDKVDERMGEDAVLRSLTGTEKEMCRLDTICLKLEMPILCLCSMVAMEKMRRMRPERNKAK